jgi:FtsZ-interacting cell division protein ZipA
VGPSVAPAHTSASSDDHSARHEPALHALPLRASPLTEQRAGGTEQRDWGVPPFEPLSIHTADFEPVQIIDPPMTAESDPLDVTFDLNHAEPDDAAGAPAQPAAADVPTARTSPPHSPVVEPTPNGGPAPEHSGRFTAPNGGPAPEHSGRFTAPNGGPAPEHGGRFTAPMPQAPNVSETQRIVAIRVCAQGESRWSGTELMAALEDHGLGFGRYKVFHRKHSDGRTLFCAASLVEPGTFDIARMPEEEYRGLTLFAVLPGPAEPVQTIDALIVTAAQLAAALHGTVQDAKGIPLSTERAQALREDVARFQGLLTAT